MASAAAASGGGGQWKPAVDYDALEDPALHWVKLADAYRTHDPAAVARILRVAKNSQWNATLWQQEMSQAFDEPESEGTDEELDTGA